MKNKVLRIGDRGPEVKKLQHALRGLVVDGVFGKKTRDSVTQFQSRNVDALGIPLVVDGVVGPLTWYAIIRREEFSMPNALLDKVVEIAESQVGVMEISPGSNRGPEVDDYVSSVGLDPAGRHPWCAAFVYWCFDKASKSLGVPNPCLRTARVLSHSKSVNIKPNQARMDPGMLVPGVLFLIKTSTTTGHMGIITAQHGGVLETIEGNTNKGGARDGIGVFKREGRNVWNINLGFINYSIGR